MTNEMPVNEAVWLTAKRGPIAVRPAPFTPPGKDEIVIRSRAAAINPIDWLMPLIGDIAFPWLRYPLVLGTDVAGEVIATGDAVTRFQIGDRVLGHAACVQKSRNNSAEGAFQTFVVLLERMASRIPDAMPFEDATVLPLGLSTAACGLFQSDYLALQPPSANPDPRGRTLLVWGGSTSVGSNAIQLAVAAGYEVVATASPRNFAYVRGLGAAAAFDYRSPTATADIVEVLRGRTIAGAIAIGAGSARACLDVVARCQGNRFVAMASPPVPFDQAPGGRRRTLWLVPTMARLVGVNASLAVKARTSGARMKFIDGGALVDNEVGPMIYRDYLPDALADGRHRAAPAPLSGGHGLASVPAAMATQKRGVSARKVVVTI